jgi:hypothetical protein
MIEDITEANKRLEWYEKKYGPYIETRGLHNWKNLFKWPNGYEWTILVMIALSIFLGYAYQHDTAICRDTLNNLPGVLENFSNNIQNRSAPNYDYNFSFVQSDLINKSG